MKAVRGATLGVVCALGCVVLPASAASFDCSKAKQADEKAICADRQLSELDVQMATTYRLLRGLFAMGMRGNLGDSQLAWLEQRRACGARKACLKQRYQERLDALQKVYDGIDKPI
ncbi:lysozyme inhibitor LprI family protein [Pseudomonas sp. PSE14]|uniref:lysozyme inhibitor LprI family protein n=1 Tax=Pseudomonas sp. PSE14 TaxID=3016341 RepID=UPI0023D853EA|nr:lysozyme inhibitor LprI family protein [Pseudomonas sp. PSE14]WEJ74459.1 lysozyme inhibitor LprI family protein [Pseudomonas sp. PSE14]